MLKKYYVEWMSFMSAATASALIMMILMLGVHIGISVQESSRDLGRQNVLAGEMHGLELKLGYELAGLRLQKMVEAEESLRELQREEIQEAKIRTAQIEAAEIEEQRKQEAEAAARAETLAAAQQRKEAEAAAAGTQLSSGDYTILQRIVQAEAGGCDIKGRILVANVVMNRVRSSQFPDNVRDVVYQKSQFSPVYDGSLDRCKVSTETKEAVDRALAGEDYSQGALYFMNRAASAAKNVRWFDGKLSYLFRHGAHEFYR